MTVYGKNVTQTQLAEMNMLNTRLGISPDFINLLETQFLRMICEKSDMNHFMKMEYFDEEVHVCPVINMEVPGMPGIIMKSDNAGKEYSFSSRDYFLFPTHKSQT